MVIIDYKWPTVQALLTIPLKIVKTAMGKDNMFLCQDTLTSKEFLSPYTCVFTHTHTHTHIYHRAYI